MTDIDKIDSDPGNTEAEPAEGTSQGQSASSGQDPKSQEPTIELVDSSFEFAIPEGSDINKDSFVGLRDFMAEEKMPKESAQKMFNHLIEMRDKALSLQKESDEAAKKKFEAEIKADPEIGGTNYEAVQKAVDSISLKFGGADFQKAVTEANLKSDPGFLRFIRNLNMVLTEDTVRTTSQASGSSDRPETEEELSKRFFKQ